MVPCNYLLTEETGIFLQTNCFIHPFFSEWAGGGGIKKKRLLIFLFLNLSSCLYSASPLCSTWVKYLTEGEMERNRCLGEKIGNNYFLTSTNSFTLLWGNSKSGAWKKKQKNEVEAEKYLRTLPFSIILYSWREMAAWKKNVVRWLCTRGMTLGEFHLKGFS